jgi:hypothetical protein
MNSLILLNTNLALSDKIIRNCNNICESVEQVDCKHAMKVFDYIKNINCDMSLETQSKTELINKICMSLYDLHVKKEVNANVELFMKVCLLYCNGGIMLNSNIRVLNMDALKELYETHDCCTIQSYVNNSNIFDGVFIAKKHSETLFTIINACLDRHVTDIDINTMLLSTAHLLHEQIVNDKSNIIYMGQTIAEHYFKTTCLVHLYPITVTRPVNLTKLKIGITVALPSTLKDFYSNGIKQNCLYLYELLRNMQYQVYLIIDEEKNASVFDSIDFFTFSYISINNVFAHEFDIIFSMGFSIPTHILTGIKHMGTKVVYYMCGNNYLIDSEKILYNQHKQRTINYENDQMYDQIWIIPQMYNQNKYYCEILQRTKCLQIPFIWSPMSIKFIAKILQLDDDVSLMYKKKDSKIGIFEPNISVMKWALPSLLIAENAYRTYRNVKHVYVTNMNKKGDEVMREINDFNTEQFNNVCRGMELFKDRKISVESRYVILEFMSKNCDIAISHQWENPLNYLYFDLAWMGWPILHNAHLCKDVGYYYEGFNYYEGSEQLNNILLNHDANAQKYTERNREIIDAYIPSNKELQSKYRNLIENLFT